MILISFEKKMVIIPNSLTVELSGFSSERFSGLSELSDQKATANPAQLTESFFSDSRSTDSVIEENQRQYFLPPRPSHEAIKKANMETMEHMLQEAGVDSSSTSKVQSANEQNMLSEDDYEKGQRLKDLSASDNTGTKEGQKSVPPGTADIDSGLDLSGLGRRVVFSPAKPDYPEWAKRDLIQGTVKLTLTFDIEGFVVGVKVIQSSGNTRLDIIAKNYAQQLRIQPGTEDVQECYFFMNFKL